MDGNAIALQAELQIKIEEELRDKKEEGGTSAACFRKEKVHNDY